MRKLLREEADPQICLFPYKQICKSILNFTCRFPLYAVILNFPAQWLLVKMDYYHVYPLFPRALAVGENGL